MWRWSPPRLWGQRWSRGVKSLRGDAWSQRRLEHRKNWSATDTNRVTSFAAFFCVEKNPSPPKKERRKQPCFAPRTCWPVSNLQYCMLDAAGLLVKKIYLCDASLPVGQSLLSVLSLHFVLVSVCCLGLDCRGISLMRTHPDSQRRNSHYVPLTSCLSCCFPSFHLIAKKKPKREKKKGTFLWQSLESFYS